ncbi:MAG: WD40 repeat domain-containing protein [Planctomycetota bacterium]|nr:WD40 repeat domain-containing protein [Planctomycetota bacterium]
MARADAQAGAGHYGDALHSYQEAIHRNAPAAVIKRRAASALYLAGENDKAQAIWPGETSLALLRSAFHGACQPYKFEGHAGAVGAVAIDPAGRFGVSVGSEFGSELKLWNFLTGKPVFKADAGNSHYAAVSFGEDGKHFLTGRVDGPIRLWSIEQQKKIQRFTHEGDELIHVALIFETNRAITASRDGQIRSWYLPNASQTGEMKIAQGFTHFKVSSNGLKGLSCSGHEWHQWDFRNWSKGTLPGGREITAVALAPDGLTAAVAHVGPVVEIWDLRVPEKIGELHGHTGQVISIAYGGNTHNCVTVSEDGTIRLWHLPTSRCLMTREDAPGVPIALDLECRFCLRAGPDSTVRLWDLGTPYYATPFSFHSLHEQVKASTRQPPIEKAAQAASKLLKQNKWGEAARVVSQARKTNEGARNPHLVRLWHQSGLGGIRRSLTGGWQVRSFRHPVPVTSAVLSPDHNQILTGDSAGALRLWDVDSGEVIRTFTGHTSMVNCIAWHPERASVATGSGLFRGADCSARVWDISSGETIHHLEFQQGIAAITFSPGGRWVLAGGREVLREAALQLFDAETGNVLRNFEHIEPVSSVCFHPAGLYCAGGSEDTTFVIWDISKGRALKICVGHEELVAALSFSPSGRLLVSGSLDGTIRIWNVKTWETIKTIEVGEGVTSLAFTPDGRFVITALLDSSIRILDLQSGQILHELKGHEGEVKSVCFSQDGSRAVSASMDGTAAVWELDWDYTFPDPSTDPGPTLGALLQCFIYLHSPVDPNTLRPNGPPQYSDAGLETLLQHLQHCGLGWLPTKTVKAELAKLSAAGKGK